MNLQLYPITELKLPPEVCRERDEQGVTFALFIQRDGKGADTSFIKQTDYDMSGKTLQLNESQALKTADRLLIGQAGTGSSWLYCSESGWHETQMRRDIKY
jgi:hypothetical protein